MKYFTEYTAEGETAVTIGKFDGFHLGHQKLIKYVKEYAAHHGMLSVAVSFYPHPSGVLNSDGSFGTIYTRDEKINLIEAMGLDIYVEYPFTIEFSKIEAETFAEDVIFKKLRCKYLAVGKNYRFGRSHKGDGAVLEKIAGKYGAKVDIVGNVMYNGEVASSSLIRKSIEQNEFDKVNELMLRPYYVTGIVAHGRKIGRRIGIPTLNIVPQKNKLLPSDGVYLTRTCIADSYYKGITNIGTNPTVSYSGERTIETHLFDFDQIAYGEKIKVAFIRKVRETVKFKNTIQLKEQIEKDIKICKEEIE